LASISTELRGGDVLGRRQASTCGPDAADRKARTIVEDLRAAKMHSPADLVERSASETLTYYAFLDTHRQKIRTTDVADRWPVPSRRSGAVASGS
jgi:hypothetical protein